MAKGYALGLLACGPRQLRGTHFGLGICMAVPEIVLRLPIDVRSA
jgi:hypothetical protein